MILVSLQGTFKSATECHVIVTPTPGLYEKSKSNLDARLKVYLLVPRNSLAGTRQISSQIAAGQITSESVESFVSQDLEEIASFSQQCASQFRLLIETYNDRVSHIETDKSLLIEIPENLLE